LPNLTYTEKNHTQHRLYTSWDDESNSTSVILFIFCTTFDLMYFQLQPVAKTQTAALHYDKPLTNDKIL